MVMPSTSDLRARRKEAALGDHTFAAEHKRAGKFGPVQVQKLSIPRNLKGLPPAYIESCRVSDSALALATLLGVFLAVNAGNLPNGLAEFLEVRVTVENILLLVGFLVV